MKGTAQDGREGGGLLRMGEREGDSLGWERRMGAALDEKEGEAFVNIKQSSAELWKKIIMKLKKRQTVRNSKCNHRFASSTDSKNHEENV